MRSNWLCNLHASLKAHPRQRRGEKKRERKPQRQMARERPSIQVKRMDQAESDRAAREDRKQKEKKKKKRQQSNKNQQVPQLRLFVYSTVWQCVMRVAESDCGREREQQRKMQKVTTAFLERFAPSCARLLQFRNNKHRPNCLFLATVPARGLTHQITWNVFSLLYICIPFYFLRFII